MTRLRLAAAVVAIVISNPGQAQRPDLTGEWVRADSAPTRSVAATGDGAFRRGDMGSGWSATLGITQRADSFVVAYDLFSSYDLQPRVRLAYAMSGEESRNGVMIGHAEYVQRSRLTWRGDSLVITTIHAAPKGAASNATTEVRQVLALDAGNLVVETTRGANTVRTTYRKK